MGSWSKRAREAISFAAEAAAETLWPTRCAICDVPGAVLCDECAGELPYLDWWRACSRCGSPYGRVQCDACNPISLALIGRDDLPFAACASAVMFSPEVSRLVRVFKDQGEQRLAAVMAGLMLRALPPGWPIDAVTYVPATLAAARHRGFDHAELIAREVASGLGTPCEMMLARPRNRDQRGLSGKQRIENLAGRFAPLETESGFRPQHVLLVDDVYTTGATLCAATDALLNSNIKEVRCLTFARV